MSNNQIDISGYSQAKSAAKAVKGQIEEIARTMGQQPDIEITLREEDGAYVLYWEAGPHYWTMKMTGEQPVWGAHPEVVGWREVSGFYAEPKNSFALVFGNY